GSQRQSPGRVERAPGGEAPDQGTAGVVNVDEPAPRAGDCLGPAGALLGVGDEEQVVDVLNVEGGKAARQVRVLEGTGAHDRPEFLVEHIDRAVTEIGGIEEAVAGVGREGESRVVGPGGGIIDRQEGTGRINDGSPAGDGAVLGGEQETAGCGNAV